MQPKTVAKRCRQIEEKDSLSMLRAILDNVVEYMTKWAPMEIPHGKSNYEAVHKRRRNFLAVFDTPLPQGQ